MSLAQFGIEEAAINHAKEMLSKKQSKKLDWKKYLSYHLKWQLGFIITVPLMYLFLDVLHINYLLSVFLFQLIGAFIFYPIDNSIFNKQSMLIDQLYTVPTLGDENKDALLKDHVEELKQEALTQIVNPDFSTFEEFGDWKSKVPPVLQKAWEGLSEETKLSVYYLTKLQALDEED